MSKVVYVAAAIDVDVMILTRKGHIGLGRIEVAEGDLSTMSCWTRREMNSLKWATARYVYRDRGA